MLTFFVERSNSKISSLYLENFELAWDLDLHLMIITKGTYKNWDNFYILD